MHLEIFKYAFLSVRKDKIQSAKERILQYLWQLESYAFKYSLE